jgi:hypothetical protein
MDDAPDEHHVSSELFHSALSVFVLLDVPSLGKLVDGAQVVQACGVVRELLVR